MDLKRIIFDLARYEKGLCKLGAFNSDDEAWIKEALGDFNDNFTHDDLYGLSVQDISELIFDFIEHCEEEGGN